MFVWSTKIKKLEKKKISLKRYPENKTVPFEDYIWFWCGYSWSASTIHPVLP